MMAEALITQGIALARLRKRESAHFIFQKAIQTALRIDAPNIAGLAALTMIEEIDHLSPTTLQAAYQQAREWLSTSQSQDTKLRLGDAAGKVTASVPGDLSSEQATEILLIKPGDLQQRVLDVERETIRREAFDPTPQLWTMNTDGTNQAVIADNVFGDSSPGWTANAAANQSPIANSGGPYSGLIAQNVAFSAAGSFDPDGTIASYAWNFGDGATGSGVTPTHAFASAGTYNISLTVTDNLGAQATANTTATITIPGSEQYLANFNMFALGRQPYANESAYWNDILRAAYPNGQTSMVLAVRELGKTLFESTDYAARNRDNHWYTYDLYRTYLMREPDAPGWSYWEGRLNVQGSEHLSREQLRRVFHDCDEFVAVVGTLTPVGSPSVAVSSLASARNDPFNQPGNGLASRDAEWNVSLLSLPGRAGLDLGLSLSYSSMVWTHSGPYIYFDEDNGWPSRDSGWDSQQSRREFLTRKQAAMFI
jgi:PKD repeat protein